jgi:AbrB family looped-hinge helix DNA binding protein
MPRSKELHKKKGTQEKVSNISESKVSLKMKGTFMPTATVTSKGQITIPVKVRKALGLKPGVRVDFYEIQKGEFILRPKNGSIMDMRGCLPKPDHPLSNEEMNQAILDRAAELDKATRSDPNAGVHDGEAA